jgi:serine/threonine-protein kinase
VGKCPSCQESYDDAAFCPRDGARLVGHIILGKVVGDRYRLSRKVGEGAMGEVYEGEHANFRRRVAVKVLHRRFATDADAVARLQREAEATGGLRHPNIVDSIDFGRSADGHVYLVMEWLDGETLEQRLRRGSIEAAEAIEIALQTARGLGAAHARGIIHRDVKPANLFLTRDVDGKLVVKVLDFGIAKVVLEQT